MGVRKETNSCNTEGGTQEEMVVLYFKILLRAQKENLMLSLKCKFIQREFPCENFKLLSLKLSESFVNIVKNFFYFFFDVHIETISHAVARTVFLQSETCLCK